MDDWARSHSRVVETFNMPDPYPILSENVTKDRAMDVLLTAADLYESMVGYVLEGSEGSSHSEPGFPGTRSFVLDRAMDLYHAVAEYVGYMEGGERPVLGRMDIDPKWGAEILSKAALVLPNWDSAYGVSVASEWIVSDLTSLCAANYTEDEVLDAYTRCVMRRRMEVDDG